jgi:hypothetical protein
VLPGSTAAALLRSQGEYSPEAFGLATRDPDAGDIPWELDQVHISYIRKPRNDLRLLLNTTRAISSLFASKRSAFPADVCERGDGAVPTER